MLVGTNRRRLFDVRTNTGLLGEVSRLAAGCTQGYGAYSGPVTGDVEMLDVCLSQASRCVSHYKYNRHSQSTGRSVYEGPGRLRRLA